MRAPTKRLLFSQKVVQKHPVPKNVRVNIYDEKVRDLGLRIEPSGRKSFFWRRKIQGRPVFKAIGVFPATSVDQARGKAHEYSGDLDVLKRNNFEGKNPFEQPQGEPTLGSLLEDYVDRHIKEKKGKTKRPEKAEADARWMFSKYLATWRDRKLSMIRRKDVLDLHGEIGKAHGHYTANRVIQMLRTMFNFAVDAELTSIANPARKVKLFHEEKRKRFVKADEMPRLFAALKSEQNPDLVDYVNLCLWCGARKSDTMGMRWKDVLPLQNNRWDIPDPKGGVPYAVPLTNEAVGILKRRLAVRKDDCEWVFPSKTSASGHLEDLKGRWKELLKRAEITGLRQHDLRRTLASWQAGQGTSLLIIAKGMGHASMASTEVYARMDLEPVREAVVTAVTAMVKASKKKVKPAARQLAASNG